jgi:hypothetical protein
MAAVINPGVKEWWIRNVGNFPRISDSRLIKVFTNNSTYLGAFDGADLSLFFSQVVELFMKKSPSDSMVSIKDFDLFVLRFGPLDQCMRLVKQNYFNDNLTVVPWFHGNEAVVPITAAWSWLVRLIPSRKFPVLFFMDNNQAVRQFELCYSAADALAGRPAFYVDNPNKKYYTIFNMLNSSRLRDRYYNLCMTYHYHSVHLGFVSQ